MLSPVLNSPVPTQPLSCPVLCYSALVSKIHLAALNSSFTNISYLLLQSEPHQRSSLEQHFLLSCDSGSLVWTGLLWAASAACDVIQGVTGLGCPRWLPTGLPIDTGCEPLQWLGPLPARELASKRECPELRCSRREEADAAVF